MPIFKKEKDKEGIRAKKDGKEKEKKSKALTKASNFAQVGGSNIIIKPHITEKSNFLNEAGVYVFKVSDDSNKIMITSAIKELYKVKPVKVNIINIPPSRIFLRGKRGTTPGFKKAIVYLKKGEKIEIA